MICPICKSHRLSMDILSKYIYCLNCNWFGEYELCILNSKSDKGIK